MVVARGNLNNGSNAGLSCVNGNNDLSNTRWNHGARISMIRGKAVHPRERATGNALQGARAGMRDPGWAGTTPEGEIDGGTAGLVGTLCANVRAIHR